MKRIKFLSMVFLLGVIFIFASCEKQEIKFDPTSINTKEGLIKFLEMHKTKKIENYTEEETNLIGTLYITDQKQEVFIPNDAQQKGFIGWIYHRARIRLDDDGVTLHCDAAGNPDCYVLFGRIHWDDSH